MIQRFAIPAVLVLLLLPLRVLAATTTLSGTVTTPQHDPIAAAAVTLVRATSVVRATTDIAGTFRLTGLAAGTYALTVTSKGYEPLRGGTIGIGGEAATISVILRPSTASALNVIASVTSTLGNVSTASAPTRTIGRSQLEGAMTGKLSDVLANQPALAPIRSAGGGSNAPFSVALRGPDPTETLVEIDGHRLNSGTTGTFDLSLIDPALLDDVELVYGIAPSSLVGPDTIGGAVNIRTVEPTQKPHAFARLSSGSFGATSLAIQTTGTESRVGYALALDTYSTGGDVLAYGTGSAARAQNALLKLRTPIAGGRGFVQFTTLNQTTDRDISAALSSIDPAGTFTSFSGSREQTHDALYGLDLQLPIGPLSADGVAAGTLTVRLGTERNAESVSGPASNLSEEFFNYAETSMDDVIQYDRIAGKGTFTVQYSAGSDTLVAPFTGGGVTDNAVGRHVLTDSPDTDLGSTFQISEIDRTFALRYLLDATPHLHYSAALYDGSYSSFGHSLDPRFGFTWTPTPRTAIAASVGTTFQAPQLTELFVPSPLPPVDANGPGGVVAIGNANVTADRATEYGLGFQQIFGSVTRPVRFTADFYQNNLRNTIEQYVPPARPAYSYPINLGDVRYRGVELQIDAAFARNYHLTAQYVVNSAFPTQVPATIQNGTLVAGQQFEGTPLHRASLEFSRANVGRQLSFAAAIIYEGSNNELSRPPFAFVNAAVTDSLKSFDLTLSATNLTNVYADRFTFTEQGVPYPGPAGPIATDAYSLPARAWTLTLSKRL